MKRSIGRAVSRLRRAAVKAPNLLYRARLGWLLGHRFVMVEHRGRKTGLLRRTTLEVTRSDPGGTWVDVVAGYGTRSDWYRNAVAAGHVRVHLAARRFTARVIELDEPGRQALLREYQARHPRAAQILGARVLQQPFTGTEEDVTALAARLPAIRLRQTAKPQAGANLRAER